MRPGFLLAVDERLWVIDRLQPAAVVLDPVSAEPVTTVGWPRVAPGEHRSTWGRQVRPGPGGVWVQEPGGPVVLVAEAGLRSGHYSAGLAMRVASAHGAWCLPDPPPQDIAATEDAPPLTRGGVAQLQLARPDAPTATVQVREPLLGGRNHNGDLCLCVETGPWTRTNLGTPTAWNLTAQTAWLRLPAHAPVPAELTLDEHRSQPPPPGRAADRNGGQRSGTPWLHPPASTRPEPEAWSPGSEEAAGLRWQAGWVPACRTVPREVVVVAWDSLTGEERIRVDIGPGNVTAMTLAGDFLWIAVEQPRHTGTYSTPTPTSLLRIDVHTGAVETVLTADTVDVTEHCWPLPDQPVDTDDYVTFWRDRFTDLEHFWTDQQGNRQPLATGLDDSRTDVVGSWPDTALHITFAHPARPGRRLLRIVPLFDELGRQVPPEYADINLMEDLETGRLPADGAASVDPLEV